MRPKVESVYPLSPMQEGMLFHTLYAPESGVYCVQIVYPMRQRLNIDAFERAWQLVTDRHAALRTSFVWEDLKKPVQVVEKKLTVPLTELDWRSLPVDERVRRLGEFLGEDRARGFDVSAPPLMRLTLIRESEQADRFVWSWHHLLMDGWSASLVVQEVRSFYDVLCRGQQPVLPAVRPFQNYIAWLNRQDPTEAEGYWRRALRGFTTPTRIGLMTQRGKPEETGKRYGQEHARLSATATAALQAAALKQRLTLNTLAQGAWAMLLSRHSNESDVLFGTVVSGRPAELPGVETMVGLFINTLPVRLQVDAGARVWAWLKELQGEQTRARRYEYTPLVQAQGWSEVPRGVNMFETLFVFENYARRKSQPEAAGREPQEQRVRSYEQVNYPLTMVVVPDPQLIIEVSYDCARIDTRGARQILSHYTRLLESLAGAEDSTRICDLEMLSYEERRQLLSAWNETAAEYSRESLPKLFEKQVAQRGEAPAVVYGQQSLSYAELNRRANRLAHYLRRLGVRKGAFVGVCVEHCVDMVVSVLAIVKAGGAYVPLDPGYPKHRLSFMLKEARISLLLTVRTLLNDLPEHDARAVCLDADWDTVAAESDENPASGDGGSEQIAYVIYTSGSTGTPKGVMIPQRAINRLVLGTDYVKLGPADRVAQVSNFSFDALTFELWGALLCGGCIVGISRDVVLSPSDFAREIRERGISAMFITTALFNQTILEDPCAFSSVRHLLIGGEAADPKRMREALLSGGRPERLLNVYGPTECTTFASWHEVEEVADGSATVPIGLPVANTTAYVLDKQLSPVPTGTLGELYIGGDGLAHGYLDRPALTAEKFIPDPFSGEPGSRLYRTGDLVRRFPSGEIEFIGRYDGQVKLRGFRIELEEIERSLSEHPQVGGCAVVMSEDGADDRRLVAYVTAGEHSAPSSSQLRGFLKQRLPEYMVPSAFVVIDSLPLTPNGKVDRRALPDVVETGPERETPFVPPRTELELKLVHIWEEVFGTGPIGVTDNFFELGGHSLLAVRLVAQIHKQFGKSIGLSVLLEEGNIANLAKVLRPEAEAAQHSPLVAIQARGERRRFFCVHAIGGQVLGYYHLARRLGPDQPFYGLQAPFLTEIGDETQSIERMAAGYVDAVRSMQPEGPYLLGGYSYGGYVAFEMARQFRGVGEDVALLAIMDTPSPNIYHQFPREDDDAYTLAMLARVRAREKERELSVSHEYLRQLPPDEQLRHIFEQLKRVGIFDESMTEELGVLYIRSFLQGHKARQQAIYDYQPGTYDQKVTLFRCAEVDLRQLEVFERLGVAIEEPTFGWRELTTEPVEVYEVPGYHERMCQEPYVQVLAEQLTHCIEEAESCLVR
jgi:amino acid adenylation domain-containing protein